ncbi:hypothetical protein SeMB42_g05228 [Synchytrium endobioticum]|uniref:Uncharacterized protein n=1 Tax=Synchytrium endobioticum TaxID=286115 RepID=A0A507CSX8_9FUNG|nr:hypothetical protein SeMB42_g05228 [Synchytrium endobioticum]TPX47255.1 hypothetical protein SeLEV6574_g02754 [Synchytrium endobioticum]
MYAVAILLLSILQLAPGFPMNPNAYSYLSLAHQNSDLTEKLQRSAMEIMTAIEEFEKALSDNAPERIQRGRRKLDEYSIQEYPETFKEAEILLSKTMPLPESQRSLEMACMTYDLVKKLASAVPLYLENPNGSPVSPFIRNFIMKCDGSDFQSNFNAVVSLNSDNNPFWLIFKEYMKKLESTRMDGRYTPEDSGRGVSSASASTSSLNAASQDLRWESTPSFSHYQPYTSIAPWSTSERDRTTEQNNDDITEYRGGWQF